MLQYRLSIGEIITNPYTEAYSNNTPVYVINYQYLSDVLDSPDEALHTAQSLCDISPVAFGCSLEFDCYYMEDILHRPASQYREPIEIVGYSDSEVSLYLEIINWAFYGVVDVEEVQYYSQISDMFYYGQLDDYQSSISCDTLEHRFKSSNSFFLEGKNRYSSDTLCFKYKGVVYNSHT